MFKYWVLKKHIRCYLSNVDYLMGMFIPLKDRNDQHQFLNICLRQLVTLWIPVSDVLALSALPQDIPRRRLGHCFLGFFKLKLFLLFTPPICSQRSNDDRSRKKTGLSCHFDHSLCGYYKQCHSPFVSICIKSHFFKFLMLFGAWGGWANRRDIWLG